MHRDMIPTSKSGTGSPLAYTMHGCPICDLELLSDAQYYTAHIIKSLGGRERLKKEEQMKNSRRLQMKSATPDTTGPTPEV